jgi:primosomal protein N'
MNYGVNFNKKEPFGWWDIAVFILAAIAISFIMTSCKTIETTSTDKSKIDRKDSVVRVVETKTDTIYQTIVVEKKDSATNEKSGQVEIVFVAGGGTWNSQTGEATNVQSVKTSEKEKNLRIKIEDMEVNITELHKELKAKSDSITQLKQQNNVQTTHKEKQKSSWYWWLVIGFGLGVGAIIALKKIPATSWLMAWL